MSIPFRTKWFDEKNRALWDDHLVAAFDSPIERYLEIGVGEGHSMRWVLENLKPTEAIGIDPYIPKKRKEAHAYVRHERNMEANLAEWIENGTLTLIRKQSIDVLPKWLHSDLSDGEKFDLIYVDGDHQCFPCLMDCVLCWPFVRVGGIMIMDDYDRRYQRGWPMTREAIDAFLNGAEKQYDLVWGEPRRADNKHVAIRRIRE